MNDRINESMNERLNKRINKRMNERMNEQINERMTERNTEWKNEWMEERKMGLSELWIVNRKDTGLQNKVIIMGWWIFTQYFEDGEYLHCDSRTVNFHTLIKW